MDDLTPARFFLICALMAGLACILALLKGDRDVFIASLGSIAMLGWFFSAISPTRE